ncbi:hypothetical protein Forpi1262_v013489 [Fusarium oxysporum f. sp. raphani]|uniref:Uncharacterized protein n=1 Tax=Fusarium oxysporum f. sp. raphani TaxID=96318 RepID=A0A8J5UK43_FUSOX|nr:hypothetical protein Forpi1262_v013489 [Fusarium oxysporum f. sp. raphani]WKT50956.1 hypothetical protein QSH57_015926 [Fusarium oxysporum f. sp. vasinfectum]
MSVSAFEEFLATTSGFSSYKASNLFSSVSEAMVRMAETASVVSPVLVAKRSNVSSSNLTSRWIRRKPLITIGGRAPKTQIEEGNILLYGAPEELAAVFSTGLVDDDVGQPSHEVDDKVGDSENEEHERPEVS